LRRKAIFRDNNYNFIMKKRLSILCFFLICTSFSRAQNSSRESEIAQDLIYFDNNLASKLKKTTTKSDLSKIKNPVLQNLANQLLSKAYDPAYRLASYSAVLSPAVLGNQLSIGEGYSRYENMTGMHLDTGENIVFVSGIHAAHEVKLLIPHWNRRPEEGISPTKDPNGWGLKRQEFKLKNGLNIIEVKDYASLAYIEYLSDEPAAQTPIQVHFVSGQVNGYFDIEKHQDTDWNYLLDHAVSHVLDAKGRHAQIAYPASDLKKYAYNRGVELLNNYDSLVYRQHVLMGLVKYNRVPKNRILSRVNYNYYMFRDRDGVAYMGGEPSYAINRVADPARVIKDACWGFSHEVGHVHQLRRYFNWAGMGEVSNNVFTMYVTLSFGNKSNLADRQYYTKAKENIRDKKISYLQDEDNFTRLVPFWQLHLYFEGQETGVDFYPDLFEKLRQQSTAQTIPNTERNPAVYQLNFVKTACEVGGVDLSDFFEQYGFFVLGDFQVKDYSSAQYVMTAQMVEACKAAIRAMNLPKPRVDISSLVD